MKTAELPFKIRIATPCPARWEDMGGDDRVRFCDGCKKNVYNLSSMTAPEAIDLLAAKQGKLCARIYQRTDGMVLTEDCPVGLARHWRRVKARVAGAVAAILFLAIGTVAFARDRESHPMNQNDLRNRVLAGLDDAKWTVKGWFGVQRPARAGMIMGDIAVVVPPPVPTSGNK